MNPQESNIQGDELELVKSGLCRSHSTRVNLALTSSALSWSIGSNTKCKGAMPVSDILTCTCSNSQTDESSGDLRVHYINRKKFVFKIKSVVFRGTIENCELWGRRIDEAVARKCPQRPKRLIIFINPISGRARGETVYNSKAAPVLQLCKVHTDVRVTERAHHVEEILDTYDLTSVDGLVSVGGDGTYAEVANGLIRRTAKDAGIDDINQDVELPHPSLPIGIIPTGTGDGIANAINRTSDAVTAALRIVLGDTTPKDICSIRCEGKLLCYSILLTAWGIFANLIYWAEAHRSMLNIFRYAIAFPRMCCPNGVIMEAEVEYDEIVSKQSELDSEITPTKTLVTTNADTVHTVGSRTSDTSVHSQDIPAQSTADAAESDVVPYLEYNTVKKTVSGSYIHIGTLTFDYLLRKENALSNGEISFGLMEPCGCCRHAMNWIEILKMEGRSQRKIDHPGNLACRVTSIRVRATGDFASSKHATYINCDGDVVRLPSPGFEVRMHPQLTRLYGTWTHGTK